MTQLQNLVDHFNGRYELEHNSSFRPFILKDGQVSGRFGPVRLGSVFTPVRDAENYETIIGHIAQLSVTNNDFHQIQNVEVGNLLNNAINQPADLVTIINFDRLCRTVHLLNYLAIAHLNGKLFLDVDPRHILAVKHDHGTYFEEVLVKCGFEPGNIVVSVTLNNQYLHDFDQLLEGLNNYRSRGYQIAFTSSYRYDENASHALVKKSSPHYLRINAPSLGKNYADSEISWVSGLKSVLDEVGGQAILQQVDNESQALLASQTGFGSVQGGFYDRLSIDHLRCL